MRSWLRCELLLLALLLAPAAWGQVTADVFPALPTPQDPVTIVVRDTGLCGSFTSFTRTGNTIDVIFTPAEVCVLPPGETATFNVGLLPAGTYTVRATGQDFETVVLTTFAVVASTTVPTLETWALLLMAVLLAVIALRR